MNRDIIVALGLLEGCISGGLDALAVAVKRFSHAVTLSSVRGSRLFPFREALPSKTRNRLVDS